ncbi:MAG: tetratricopeptide repeat protein [Candidatus Glassbacteria bacterium]|nr:tetratricopeptide repeat protein [Candidatus Glassbacteria bacterium]
MGRKRITKKKLKEDAFVSATFEAGHFIQENLTRLVMGVVGVLVLIAMVWMYFNYRREQVNEAELALFKAQGLYLNGQFALAASDFERVAEEYSGTAAGDKALFFAGDAHYNAGDLNQALTRFEECREKLAGDNPLMLNAVIGQAAVYEQMEDLDKAAAHYGEALKMAVYDYQKIEVMDALSRVLAMEGKNEEALEMMDRIIEDYPDNPRTGSIVERKAELLARFYAATEKK